MKHRVFSAYGDAAEYKMSSISKNVVRMTASATAINALYKEAEACPTDIKTIQETTAKELTELRKSQEALVKSLKRKESELSILLLKESSKMIVPPPAELSTDEMEHIVEVVQQEEQSPHFESIEDGASTSPVDVCIRSDTTEMSP